MPISKTSLICFLTFPHETLPEASVILSVRNQNGVSISAFDGQTWQALNIELENTVGEISKNEASLFDFRYDFALSNTLV